MKGSITAKTKPTQTALVFVSVEQPWKAVLNLNFFLKQCYQKGHNLYFNEFYICNINLNSEL